MAEARAILAGTLIAPILPRPGLTRTSVAASGIAPGSATISGTFTAPILATEAAALVVARSTRVAVVPIAPFPRMAVARSAARAKAAAVVAEATAVVATVSAAPPAARGAPVTGLPRSAPGAGTAAPIRPLPVLASVMFVVDHGSSSFMSCRLREAAQRKKPKGRSNVS